MAYQTILLNNNPNLTDKTDKTCHRKNNEEKATPRHNHSVLKT